MINFIRTSIYRTFNRSMTVLLLIRGDFYVAQRRRKRGRNNNKNLTTEKMARKNKGKYFKIHPFDTSI